MKVCTKCGLGSPEGGFPNVTSHGRRRPGTWCQLCTSTYQRAYRAANLSALNEYHAIWREKNAEPRSEQKRLYYLDNQERLVAAAKARRVANPQYHADYCRTRRASDPAFRLACALRERLGVAIRQGNKSGSAVRDLGCTIPELKAWLEAKFYPHPETGEVMTWDNWSPTGWHIDHRKPLKSFDLSDREQLLRACSYTNLQPLWAFQNLAKGAREAA